MYLWLQKIHQAGNVAQLKERGRKATAQLPGGKVSGRWCFFLSLIRCIPTSTDEDLSPLRPSSWGRWQEYPDGSNLPKQIWSCPDQQKYIILLAASTSQLRRLINYKSWEASDKQDPSQQFSTTNTTWRNGLQYDSLCHTHRFHNMIS